MDVWLAFAIAAAALWAGLGIGFFIGVKQSERELNYQRRLAGRWFRLAMRRQQREEGEWWKG